MKKNILNNLDTKILLQLNIGALVITSFCEVFIIFTLLTKGRQSGLEQWKYYAIIGGLVLVSLLLLASVISFIFFMRLRKKNKKK